MKIIIDELMYQSYAHNRTITPETRPEQWARIFSHWREYEARFQSESWDKAMTDEGQVA